MTWQGKIGAAITHANQPSCQQREASVHNMTQMCIVVGRKQEPRNKTSVTDPTTSFCTSLLSRQYLIETFDDSLETTNQPEDYPMNK